MPSSNDTSRSPLIPTSVPAEVKKYRFDEPTIQKLLSKQWWNASPEEIEKVKEMVFRVNEYLN